MGKSRQLKRGVRAGKDEQIPSLHQTLDCQGSGGKMQKTLVAAERAAITLPTLAVANHGHKKAGAAAPAKNMGTLWKI
ncbi:hypothetical protein M2366_002884 [Aeromonas sp. BIGb0405]|uniref:hypothetical protein n=1 Tax=Aeromonas TaxID=642 RepID=UPI001CD00C8A|nr:MULTISPECIES: hypothetical protein [Aeromonas]MCS3456778.1 hypothetical protein [Aeromonas sp. BIGb0405]UBO73722.1 hypothetical protein KYK33_18240 [Aeromonas rivuli]